MPGKPDESLLLDYISGDKPEMPKDDKPLSAAEVAAIREWIASGAAWPAGVELTDKRQYDFNWWSLRPLERPSPPAVHSDWVRTPIDAFILAKLQEQKLAPSPEADRRTLIRRLYFDLVGLPPPYDEVKAFVADQDPHAYEKLVDRLLASPGYGERWGRHWLDVVHYGDTHGYDKDKVRPNAWPYRDYVIRSFNDDKPYSRFVEEQVAGDVLYPGTADGIIATGFLVAGPFDFVGQIEVAEGTLAKAITRNLDRDDMVTTTIGTFNSMTAQCARCHNHKFDPITQEDYYSLQAVFAGIDRADRPYAAAAEAARAGVVFAAASEFKPQKHIHSDTRQAAAGACAQTRQRKGSGRGSRPGHVRLSAAAWIAISSRCRSGRRRAPRGACPLARRQAESAHVAIDRQSRVAVSLRPRDRRFAERLWPHGGAADASGTARLAGGRVSRRAAVDQAIASADLHERRLSPIVGRQSGVRATATAANQFLWRMNRRRLEAEAVRDSVLAVAGKLNTSAAGRPFGRSDSRTMSRHITITTSTIPTIPHSHRRSVYRLIVRSVPDPFMATLDCADPSALVAKRNETLTPLQSLALLNNPFMVRMAEHFAERIEPLGTNTAERLTAAWRLAFGREPDDGGTRAARRICRSPRSGKCVSVDLQYE